jgi:undecaprenyl-diphosphatase
MTEHTLLVSAFLGLIEGLTEFLPVSSTAHLLIAAQFLHFEASGKTFEVVIQLGAILALLWVYAGKLWQTFSTAGTSAESRRFIASVTIAFLPAAVIGVFAYHTIKTVFFNSDLLIATALILGGIVLIVVERMDHKPRHFDASKYPLLMSLGIGFVQCLAMIPGVSRSGATIVGAMLLKGDRRSAAEFSFFLSIPTMIAATGYDMYKSWHMLDWSALNEIAVGFVVAFFSALVVVKTFLGFVQRYGYDVFAWWRIIVGLVVIGGLVIG